MGHVLEQTIRRLFRGPLRPVRGGRILVGVSGGADSMALLHILAAVAAECSLTLVAAYVDHGLRPRETPGERACVEAAARRLEIAWACESVDAGQKAAAGMSPEHAAREARYRAFADLAVTWSTDWLAVAHTADDQAEEILLRLFRGGGGRALSGMRLQSGHLIRPLLGVRKAEILAYLTAKGIAHCHDSSNDDRRFLRNRIRLDLLPLLEADYDPGIRSALLKTAANLSEDEDLLDTLLAGQWQAVVETMLPEQGGPPIRRLDRAAFGLLHPALQRRMVERLLWEMGSVARHAHILAVLDAARCGRSGGEVHLSRGLRVAIHRHHLSFSFPSGKGPWRGRLLTS